jgi:uncharacterized protein YdeI (YjbR/CyaY-like superfamily)
VEEARRHAGLKPTFFATPEEFRAWLEDNHESHSELLVGFYKKGSGKPSMSWPESVDQALCFGWIDGIRRTIDDESYTIRFTPRKPSSTWSAVNVNKVSELKRQDLMRPAGLAAYEARREDKTAIYAYEQGGEAKLPRQFERRFRDHTAAWEFFQSQAPWYRRTAIRWVAGAKKEETRERRLATLIEDSANGRTLKQLTRPKVAR